MRRNSARYVFNALALCVISQVSACAAEEIKSTKLHVMLQGENASTLRELVKANGGHITHQLPIINAVGAKLSRSQLDSILESGLITRHIDDLSPDDEPKETLPAATEACDVDGAIAMQLSPEGLSWKLYNNGKSSAVLQHVEITWPTALGTVESASLGSTALSASDQAGEGAMRLHAVENATILAQEHQVLSVTFTNPVSTPLAQSSFNVEAKFGDDCSTESIPGYPDNAENFYYPAEVGATALHQHGIRGNGVTVAVLDSGIWDHSALTKNTAGKDRILARYDAIADKEGSAFDESGHGTHLSSVVAHSGESTRAGKGTGTYKGVAPDAKLVSVKAFNIEGQGGMLDIVRGVQWVVDNRAKYNIRVLNLSFAARPRWPYWLDPINQAVMRAWQDGIVVVAAAGNEGPEPMTIGAPGNLPYIITVGAYTDSWTGEERSDDYIPDFSSRGPTPSAHIKPDLVAPGGHITGVIRPGSSLTKEHPEYMLNNDNFVLTGSSQASAVVSGVVALLLQLEPQLTPDDVKCKLISSAEPAINRDGLLAYSPFQQGHGAVSATRAITLGETGCGNIGLNLNRDILLEEHFEGPASVDEEGNITLPGLADILSPIESDKGKSNTRVWGIKDHIERLDAAPATNLNSPLNWQQMYAEEKEKIERLTR